MLHRFTGATALLSALEHALPQPDQLCGPFSASVALAAVLDDDIPDITAIAVASGSTIWPGEFHAARPPGSPRITDGWDALSTSESIEAAGTSAAGLAAGIEAATGNRVLVVSIAQPGASEVSLLLTRLADARFRFGLLANVHTGGLTEFDWNVGHFVTIWGFDAAEDTAAIGDSYRELGSRTMPPGCRTVPVAALAAAMSERGLLLMVNSGDQHAAEGLVCSLNLRSRSWSV